MNGLVIFPTFFNLSEFGNKEFRDVGCAVPYDLEQEEAGAEMSSFIQ